VSVAERKKQAAKKVTQLKKKGEDIQPICIEGRTISKTFWGKAWCKHLEGFSDYENRLPRGRTYVRNGSVIDLKVKAGEIKALVSGSSIYTVEIKINPIVNTKWETLVKECSGKIESLIELLQGKFSKGVMEVITDCDKGLFPSPREIKLNCSCYDWADMCKHVAAVLYGVGARLDTRPEDLFLLRYVDHKELIAYAGSGHLSGKNLPQDNQKLTGDLSALFGIDLEEDVDPSEIKKEVKQVKNKEKNSIPIKKQTAKKRTLTSSTSRSKKENSAMVLKKKETQKKIKKTLIKKKGE
ncbi:MAG TPA: SWIM zinc finger family protein, partial [Alphaproteobacteria bacterium]|nr:SWIM zinc finger family protein [Alphaproteobacteria bacterium]